MERNKIIWRPEEIVAMCKEAGFADGVASIVGLWGLHEFAKLVDAKATAKEREACAKEAEKWAVGANIAEEIRARAQADRGTNE